ncbi:unnamed protein product [Adineta ricciae]|uniref:Uncharacterized protein n=1 Tax=Adineta ricciae TaxID=249248 RepID=A0A814E7W2_ADIRI|nr:unnamed protein product [Adineta ricciae]
MNIHKNFDDDIPLLVKHSSVYHYFITNAVDMFHTIGNTSHCLVANKLQHAFNFMSSIEMNITQNEL